jgi:hypothetical protein
MLIAVDTETALIGRGVDLAPPLACITWCGPSMQPEIIHASHGEELCAWLFGAHEITGANFAFDACVLMRAYPKLTDLIYRAYKDGRVRDIQHNQRLIDLAHGNLNGYRLSSGVSHPYYYNLAALHERYGYGQLDKSKDTWRLRYAELIGTDLRDWPEDAVAYAKLDALATLRVDRSQQAFAEFVKDGPAQARAALALHRQSIRGMITDAQTIETYLDEVELDIQRAKALCVEHGLIRGTVRANGKVWPASKVGTRDMKAARARMVEACAELNISAKKTDGGDISLDAEACRDSGDPVMQAYALYTSAASVRERVTQLREGAKGLPLQTEYVIINNNGRTSSREPKLPLVGSNFQNVPRAGRMRECFVPRPGYWFVSVDYSMAELHTVSQCELWLTGKSKLAIALNEKRDVHCEVAAILLKCSYEEAFSKRKEGRWALARQQSKEVNFGGWGVMSADRLWRQMNKKRAEWEPKVSLEEAARIMRAWRERWEPESYFAAIRAMFPDGARDYEETATYSQFVSGRVRGQAFFPDVANGIFSGLATDAVKAALFDLALRCDVDRPGDELFDCHPVLYVHDEVIAELPIRRAHEAAYAMTDVMLRAFNRYTPDVPVRAEPALMTAWFKKAEPRFENGRLVPWM